MPDIVLTTINAKYQHSSFGLRYLMANLNDLAPHAALLEFSISESTSMMLDEILACEPKIVGLGVYIWNVDLSTRLVADLKRVRPDMIVVLGGPEVSYETDQLAITSLADYVVTGEADKAFYHLCQSLLNAHDLPASFHTENDKIIAGGVPALSEVKLPYELYSDEDLQNRMLYVEASRGCPFTCEFCLSSLEIPVRQFDVGPFLDAMQTLLSRGAKQFKFVDRTFNLNLRISQQILNFFLDRYEPGMFLHYEMIPDRLPVALRDTIKKFPPGVLQFEVGIQTFNDDVAELISRRQDNGKVAENIKFLREETGVHIHADLIVGLPGEDYDSFGRGFDMLIEMGPQEIQVGILKRLRGTPIVRHDHDWKMVYSPYAPYEILQNKLLDVRTIQRLRRFARYWDLVGNSGNFVESLPMIWSDRSPFHSFMEFSDWLFERDGKTHGISLLKLAERLFNFLLENRGLEPQLVAPVLYRDYVRGGRHDRPHFLRPYIDNAEETKPSSTRSGNGSQLPARQARHLATRLEQD